MTAPERPKLLKHLWIWTLVSGLASVILGVLLVARPFAGVFIAAILLGAYLLVSGIFQVFFAFTSACVGRRTRPAVHQRCGCADPGHLGIPQFRALPRTTATAILLLAIWIAVGFIFRGVATTVSAISDPEMPGRGWEIFFGVISVLAGIVVMASPLTPWASWLG